ncbi:GlxA family transcriptional regulator [Aliiroseovarius sp. 2305UL8-7]|uniref:GlxA family transcriptional regulator n=1 Tax=Aliiroseovarius conchicola TaxID=3121637 RepID=UPI003528A264
MDKRPKRRTLDVFLFDGVNLLDVAGPVQAFDTARYDGNNVYEHRFVSLDGQEVTASCGLAMSVAGPLTSASNADDLLIPGGAVDQFLDHQPLLGIIAARSRRTGDERLISICSGALILAASGVLDGMAATTHWRRETIIRDYESVKWDLDLICTESDRIFTSAGVTTGIDLALSIIRKDCGTSVALDVARELVVQLRRTGGQSQYAMHLAGQFTPDDSLTRLIEQIVARPEQTWSLEALAAEAGMNTRTLSRRFNTHMQISPAQFVEKTRVDHARGMMVENIPLKTVAEKSGFGDLQRMRRAFQRRFGVNLGDYLSAFRG